MRPSTIKFLLKNKANPHIEDKRGMDCCDKAKEMGEKYARIKKLNERKCDEDPSMRIKNNIYMKKILSSRFN